MVKRYDLVTYTNDFLNIGEYKDYCPNGLQVEGKAEIETVVSGVTASQALIDAAIDKQADAILVHHGYFWKGELPQVVGIHRRRLYSLMINNLNLMAYHLPLDDHADVGNNAQIGKLLDLRLEAKFGIGSEAQLGCSGTVAKALSPEQLTQRISAALGRAPLHIEGAANSIKRVAWCTGAAQSYLSEAVKLGVDAFITGEVSEQTVHIARETGVHFYAAGHHATERYGIQSLGDHLSERFAIKHVFVDIDNPV